MWEQALGGGGWEGVAGSPAQSRGALVVALAVGAKRFAVHDPPQGRHPGGPPKSLSPAYVRHPLGTGPGQGAGADLFQTQALRRAHW